MTWRCAASSLKGTVNVNKFPRARAVRNKIIFYKLTLLFGFVATVISAVCAFTPIVWIAGGRRSEDYPELFFLFVALPVSLTVFVIGLLLVIRSNRKG